MDKSFTQNAAKQISRLRSRTTTSIAIEAIEEMIAEGGLVAGDRINESTLADQLGISRGPIREACRSLEQAGLLVSRTNRGMFVREVSLDQARALYELRSAIAGLVGEVIVTRATDEEIAHLNGLVDTMQVAADGDDVKAYFKLNLEFHAGLVSAARNEPMAETYLRIVNQLHLLRRRGLVQGGSLQSSNDEHRTIMSHLVKRDGPETSKAMRTHVMNGLDRLISSI